MIGKIFSPEGKYSSIIPTAVLTEEVEKGEFLVGEDLLFQVQDVWYERLSFPGEDRLLAKGKGSNIYPEEVCYARLRILGKLEGGQLREYFGPIRPMIGLRRATQEEIEALIGVEKGIRIGRTVQGSADMKLDLKTVFRQGLIIFGSVGTGKTTTMLTILCRLIEALRRESKVPRILIIDKDGEYENLRDCVRGVEVRELQFLNIFTLKDVKSQLGLKKGSKILAKVEEILQKAKGRPVRREELAEVVGEKASILPEEFIPGLTDELLNEYLKPGISLISLKNCEDMRFCGTFIVNLLNEMYHRALEDKDFGVLLVIDEVHLFVPETRGVSIFPKGVEDAMKDILNLIATTGARNGITLFAATQRPSLVGKALTTQLGLNVISHRVADIDIGRIAEIMGGAASQMVRSLQRGSALVVTSSMRVPVPLRVRIDKVVEPMSAGKSAYQRW